MKTAIAILLLCAAAAANAQPVDRQREKLGFQASLAGQLYQAATNIEFIKTQCKSILPANAPVLAVDWRREAVNVIRANAGELVLSAIMETRDQADRRATLANLVVPGIKDAEPWCYAAVYSHVSLYSSLAKLMAQTERL
jgi:hypothetical protein